MKSLHLFKKKDKIVNYTCWYKMIELFFIFYKNYNSHSNINIDKLLIAVNGLKNLDNDKLEILFKQKLIKNNHIIFTKLQKYNNCKNDLPFFELYLIDLLKNAKYSVSDIYKSTKNVYYSNIYKHYTFDKEFNQENYNKLLIDTDLIEGSNPDIIFFYDFKSNKQLSNYFELLIESKAKLQETKDNEINFFKNKYNLFSCLLRNDKNDTFQKTLLAFIYRTKQYIIDDTKPNKIIPFNWITNDFNNTDFKITDTDNNEYNYNFSKGDNIIIFINDKCKNLDVIPQFSGTCWFNAILMASLYSEGSRNILLKQIKDNNWGNLLVCKKLIILYILYFLKPFIFATNIFIICNISFINSSSGSIFLF